MSSSTGLHQHVLSMVKLNWLLILAAILLVCCSCINSKPTDFDPLSEHQLLDNYYPNILFPDYSNFVERAAPRLGRASPRLGRASPRLGRRVAAYKVSRLNHAGRYHNSDYDAANDYIDDVENSMKGRRAAPRLGRYIEFDEQQDHA